MTTKRQIVVRVSENTSRLLRAYAAKCNLLGMGEAADWLVAIATERLATMDKTITAERKATPKKAKRK